MRILFYSSLLFFLSADTFATQKHASAISDIQPTYLVTSDTTTLDQVLHTAFGPQELIPNINSRDRQKAVWVKLPYKVTMKESVIFDFIRQDFVALYVLVGDSIIDHFETGFLLKSSEKKMHYWNAIDLNLEKDIPYTIIIRLENHINEPSIVFNIDQRSDWRESLLYGIIVDVVFLSLIFVIALYTLLIYFQNREKAFLFFALYLLAIFGFYIYILDFLRDFIVRENPVLTSFFVLWIVLAPCFYLGFMRHFLNTKELIPKYDGAMRLLAKINLALFLLLLAYYTITLDYYLTVDCVRAIVFFDILFGMFFTYQLWRKKNELVIYFIAGSALMMVGGLIDVIFWTSSESLGEIARVGFVLEIILFSLGLGKKSQLAEVEKNIAQKSYIDQLHINEKLLSDQQVKLEKKVTERTKAYKKAKEEAEKNAKVKEQFLSVMSHEIRTPMNAIVGLTHMLTSKDHLDGFDENLTTLRYSVDNLMLLVNNILDYNKISSGHVALERVTFNVRKIINSVSHLFKAKADSKGLSFEILIDEEVPDYLLGDPFRLSQVLNNFLSNAIKFTPEGSIFLKVITEKHKKGYYTLLFEVSDTGVGIPVDKQELIFQSFSQAEADTTRKFGGTGLGLAISKDLIELMNGTVSIEDNEPFGTKFIFNVEFEESDASSEDRMIGHLASSKSVNIEDLSVLIVDDNQMNRIILKKFLDKWDVNCHMAVNGVDALENLNASDYDLVLLDLQMPEMDGYQVTKIMREDPRLSRIPIIAISADTISNVYEKVISAGMDDFIAKPFNPDELKAKIYTLTAKVKIA